MTISDPLMFGMVVIGRLIADEIQLDSEIAVVGKTFRATCMQLYLI